MRCLMALPVVSLVVASAVSDAAGSAGLVQAGAVGVAAAAGPKVSITSFVAPVSHPLRITAAPDGALWLTNNRGDSIGRITTGGKVSGFRHASIDKPWGIATGRDGALWFTNDGNDSIGRVQIVTRR